MTSATSPIRRFGSQKGLTLMEVLIYAGLSLGLLLLAVTSLGHIQKSANRNQEMARLHADADEAVRMIAQDVRNLGLKRIFFSPSPGVLVDTQLTGVDYGAADSSSFLHKDGKPFDTLVFIKPKLDGIGKPTAIDTIVYFVKPTSKSLFRSVNGKNAVEICKKVDALQFDYGLYAAKAWKVNESPPVLADWKITGSGSMTQVGNSLRTSMSAYGTTSFWYSKSAITLDATHTYELEMSVSSNSNFLKNVNSMSAMFCDASGNPILSSVQTFLPSLSAKTQYLQWSGMACSNCFIGFKMTMNGVGEFNLNGLKLQDVKQSNGLWVTQPTIAQKQAVRAFRIYLLTQSSRPIFGKASKTMTLANATMTFDDNNGRSLLEDVVPIPNNGY